MGKPVESDKAKRYILQLDDARCAGRWTDVPELCRKVEKHAPHRRCLTLTARSEARISHHSTLRPSTAASTSSTGLSQIIPSLLTAIDEEVDHAQDAFQATVCLGWLHYVLEEPGLAVVRLPKDFTTAAAKLSSEDGSLSGWSRVCVVKGAFLKGSSQDRTGATDEAIQTYMSILPWLRSLGDLSTESYLFKMWTERLLVRLCQLVDQSRETGRSVEMADALYAYRLWARFYETAGTSGDNDSMTPHRRSAWKAYYATLSTILQHDLPYDVEAGAHIEAQSEKPNVRLRQRAEFKRVELVYEGILLQDIQFPKASGDNKEIEEWTDAVIANWRVLCGPTWADDDLGEGGKEAVGRGVLDILYRAATKTFHSTPVLRHLFTVHASLAEFELAFKAYDSYVEIVTRGKDRAEKSGEEDVGIDDDSLILRTSAEAIRLLCRFGSRAEVEKALQIGKNIEKWLEQTEHIKSATSEAGSVRSYEAVIAPTALAAAYWALGVSNAQWARFTYDANARTAIQSKAAQYLRKALEPRFEDPNNVETLYALGMVLAEMRDIPGAIKVVKHALSAATKKDDPKASKTLVSGLRAEFVRERRLIPTWHLLALLLTARTDFVAAEKACEAAFEQFGDPTILFGKEETSAYRSEHLNNMNGSNHNSNPKGLVDQMQSFEKAGILQIKMTQLALVETVEGPNAAVDGCEELLALFTRLFGNITAEAAKSLPVPSTPMPPPKSSKGTIRGSIFRSKSSARSTHVDVGARNLSIASSRPSTTATQLTTAPEIQVTDANGTEHATKSEHHHHHLPHPFHHKHDEEKGGVKRTPSKLKKRSANSLHKSSPQEPDHAGDVPAVPVENTNGVSARTSISREKSPRRPSMSSSVRKSMESNNRPYRTISQTAPHSHRREPSLPPLRSPQPATRMSHSDVQGLSSEYIPPEPHFSTAQVRRHKITLLIDIWIFISGLYARAGMYDDAQGAVAEAFKLVESLEAEASPDSSGSKALAHRGWGGARSIDRLWADVYAARGDLKCIQSSKHAAKSDYEQALLHFPDHAEAIVGLSNILLDIYSKVIPLEPSEREQAGAVEGFNPLSPPLETLVSDPHKDVHSHAKSEGQTQSHTQQQHHPHHHHHHHHHTPHTHTPSAENTISPPELSRVAARDRAFGLLSTLTKLGQGWDYSEAWYALARAYEESGQVEKAKEVLWWCVELEDTRPVRGWGVVAAGGGGAGWGEGGGFVL
ncbi:filamentation protein-like protein [Westerdykella ornata]|uniref:Filamentation protein-like protein n=1 Tax=Westerdykella ornata TaxID=318751 RepID=A0A6A6JFY2_WESOR|nr:filamentation protein-like protein [Westerdykella ornata]KAF2275185.1 filamentation protein-like protein [Westerdykella ornata]